MESTAMSDNQNRIVGIVGRKGSGKSTRTAARWMLGEIRKRGDVYWIRYYRNGKRHEESARSARKADAERLLAIREGDVAKGVPVSAKIGQLCFEDAVKDLVNDYKANGK
jgi:ABC-type dipeptide/oligopeptide/nickel transport system ATPase component